MSTHDHEHTHEHSRERTRVHVGAGAHKRNEFERFGSLYVPPSQTRVGSAVFESLSQMLWSALRKRAI